MADQILQICEDNVSVAWAKVFLKAMTCSETEISPLIVTIKGLDDGLIREDSRIRSILDNKLISKNKSTCLTIANTIFPVSLWNEKLSRDVLYTRYLKCWPRIKKCFANRNGTYFQRMIDFRRDNKAVNQLEQVISLWRNRIRRRSGLQVVIFDPFQDHKNTPYLGFPCLDQIVFCPLGSNGKDGLIVNGFYASQYVFEKAYGNYLGLCNLGRFMAKEMRLNLLQVNCISSSVKLGETQKRDLRGMERKLSRLLNQ